MSILAFSIRSGSSGNCIYIGSETEGLIVDCGISAKSLITNLTGLGIMPSAIKGILVTHEHSDHISGIRVLGNKLNVPIFASEATLDAMANSNKLPNECQTISVRADSSFYFNNFEILPFSLPHDAVGPVGYRVFKDGLSCSVVTDLGHFPKSVMNAVIGSEIMFIESNHDIEMLNKNQQYPMYLKKRILGNKGHMSNDLCADTVINLCKAGTRHFILSHLSLHNNTYDMAYGLTYSKLIEANAEPMVDFSLDVARQDINSKIYSIK